ncbi:hypothetical protein BGW38_009245 [Lunasporangiospora selenospora]|uniref:Uncharacterized protein n=1 Tax=Lunasporangiospora selenospora TaxID=979761 RepID=A0A9P6FY15_9FUNG|nr:hypothetical protein BGW38_009245 [Lunasporangiospora selenospora]
MNFLWSSDLKINTVHVHDVIRAVWHTANWYVSSDNSQPGTPVIFNLADQNNTDQEAICTHIRTIFGIKTGFVGDALSEFSKIEEATEDTNDMHMGPWAELLKMNQIKNSPLTPFLDKELLCKNALSLDGTKITVSTGFTYEHPQLTEDSLREIITDFQEMNIWPRD